MMFSPLDNELPHLIHLVDHILPCNFRLSFRTLKKPVSKLSEGGMWVYKRQAATQRAQHRSGKSVFINKGRVNVVEEYPCVWLGYERVPAQFMRQAVAVSAISSQAWSSSGPSVPKLAIVIRIPGVVVKRMATR